MAFKRFLLVTTLVSSHAAAIQAQAVAESLARCAALQSDLRRLACFDSLAARTAKPSARVTASAAAAGRWKVDVDTSAIDDSRNVFLMLDANETYTVMGQRRTPTLILRCAETRIQVYITWDQYLGLNEVTVLTRLDSDVATRTTWNISTDNTATFNRSAPAFIRSLVGRERLLAQVTPYGESPVTVTFAVGGLASALPTFTESCPL